MTPEQEKARKAVEEREFIEKMKDLELSHERVDAVVKLLDNDIIGKTEARALLGLPLEKRFN